MSKTDKKEKRFKVSDMLQGPKRLENESYEDYKERRKVEEDCDIYRSKIESINYSKPIYF